jgi:hypothetical protein
MGHPYPSIQPPLPQHEICDGERRIVKILWDEDVKKQCRSGSLLCVNSVHIDEEQTGLVRRYIPKCCGPSKRLGGSP